jgi:hypothetical protein
MRMSWQVTRRRVIWNRPAGIAMQARSGRETEEEGVRLKRRDEDEEEKKKKREQERRQLRLENER